MVNRKQPNAAAAMSRSSSSQSVAGANGARKAQPSQLKNQVSNGSTKANGSTTSKSKQTSSKKKKASTKKSGSFIDKLFLLFLSSFIAYSVFTCRPNPIFPTVSSEPPSALCRSLHSYNVNILEPYVIPPVVKAVEFSTPYLQELKSHVDPYLEPITDKVAVVQPYVTSTCKAVVVAYKNYLRPLTRTAVQHWKVSVVPRYKRHIHPRLKPVISSFERQFDLYVIQPAAKYLEVIQHQVEHLFLLHVEPHIAKIRPHALYVWRNTHQVLHTLKDTYSTQIHPVVINLWTTTRPHLCTLLKTSKIVASKAFSQTAIVSKKAVKEGAVLRRQYVDPHLGKIWDKVSATQNSEDAFATDDVPVWNVQDDTPDPTAATEIKPTPPSEPERPKTASVVATSASTPSVNKPVIPAPEEDVLDEIPTPDVTAAFNENKKEEAQHAVSIAEESAAGASTVVYELEREAEKVGATAPPHGQPSVTPDMKAAVSPQPSLTDAPAPTPGVEVPVLEEELTVQDEPVTAKSKPSHQEDDDIDEFLRELGVSDAPTSTQMATSQEAKAAPTVSEEDIAAAKESTRAKRLDLTTRHQKWFTKLQDAVPKAANKLVEKLKASRLRKVEEVNRIMMGDKKEEGKLDVIGNEGEKLIRGLEAYLRKAITRRSNWAPLPKDGDEWTDEETKEYHSISNAEKNKWTNVVSRVDEKFQAKVRSVESEVYEWYTKVREAENSEAFNSALEVKAVAEEAQGDLGLDYAWLDDVTYRDWQKYHDLMRVYENYTQVANQLANGTDITVTFSSFSEPLNLPAPPADPLVPLLDKLYSELQDVVLGFNVALNNVRVKSLKVFSLRPKIILDENGDVSGVNTGDDDDGFFVVRDGQRRRDDLRGVDLSKIKIKAPKESSKLGVSDEEEQFVIMPIGGEPKAGDEFDASKILIGKDTVQVQEALKDVPVEPAASRHEEL